MLSPTFMEWGSVGGKQWDGQSNLVCVILLGFLHRLNGLGGMVNSTVMEMTEYIIELQKTECRWKSSEYQQNKLTCSLFFAI